MSWVRPELIIASDADKASYAFMYEANRLLRISFHHAWYVLAVRYGNDKPNAETPSNANLPFGTLAASGWLLDNCSTARPTALNMGSGDAFRFWCHGHPPHFNFDVR